MAGFSSPSERRQSSGLKCNTSKDPERGCEQVELQAAEQELLAWVRGCLGHVGPKVPVTANRLGWADWSYLGGAPSLPLRHVVWLLMAAGLGIGQAQHLFPCLSSALRSFLPSWCPQLRLVTW